MAVTLINPFSGIGLIVRVWEIGEGVANFLYVVKLVLLQNLGFQDPKVSGCRKISMQALLRCE